MMASEATRARARRPLEAHVPLCQGSGLEVCWGRRAHCFAKCPFTRQSDWLSEQFCQSLDPLCGHFAKHWACRHRVALYGDLAQEAGRVLRKGQQIAIRGKLRVDQWTDKVTQQPRKAHKIIADQVALVASPVR